jgi:hypothetical protein
MGGYPRGLYSLSCRLPTVLPRPSPRGKGGGHGTFAVARIKPGSSACEHTYIRKQKYRPVHINTEDHAFGIAFLLL